MKFTLGSKWKIDFLTVVYRDEEYSLDVVPSQKSGYASIMVNNIQLDLNDKGEVISLWGLCPLFKYKKISHFPENFNRYKLNLFSSKDLMPGISYRLNTGSEWPISVNKQSQWICIGNSNLEGKVLTEFLPNTVASLDENNLTAIWIHLEQLPDYLSK